MRSSERLAGCTGLRSDGMESTEVTIRTGSRPAVVDITAEVAAFCRERGDGLVSVFVPHATAGVAIIETGAGSEDDLLAAVG
jgi:thiamine phosphate synthase YjbQ (UPF0047 family)